MKTKILYVIAALLIVGCSANLSEVEDTEYQKYVHDTNTEFSKSNLSPQQRTNLFQQHYVESGLKAFINRSGEHLEGQTRSVKELAEFYKITIEGKYAGHEAQDWLRVSFIGYAIDAANLTSPENTQEAEFLVSLTRDLIDVRTVSNPALVQACLTATRERIEKEEYNGLVKNGRFQIRMYLDKAKAETAEPAPSEIVANQMKQLIQEYEKALTAVTALIIS